MHPPISSSASMSHRGMRHNVPGEADHLHDVGVPRRFHGGTGPRAGLAACRRGAARSLNEWLAAAGAFLDGRVTYELMAGFWPTADRDPAATPTMAEFARIWREMPKIVYSRSLDPGTLAWN